MRAFTTAIVAVLAAAPSVQAWWDNGHMLVGEVASQLMAKQDRKTIQKVLRDWEKDFPNTDRIATAAVWPDMVKCSKNSVSCSTALLPSFSAFDNWHYMNLPMNANATQWGSAPPDLSLFKKSLGGNAVNVFDTFLSTFNTTQSLWTANLALRQLIHIVADVHQPLHAVGAVSEKYPGGDTGGNLYTFKMPCRSTNLHALYDAAGGELTNYWALKMDATNAMLKKNATQLISTIPSLKDTLDFSGLMAMPYPQFSAAFVSGSYFKKMVFESYEIANAVVYPGINTTFDGKDVDCPSPSYFTQATALSKERITLAGKRLAVLLTKIAQHFRATKLV